MKVALVQTDILWNQPEQNCERLKPILSEGKKSGAQLFLLPEMFNTGFSFLIGEEAKKAYEIGAAFLENEARKEKILIAASLPKLSDDNERPQNAILIYGPEGLLGEYAKRHLFSYGGEDKYYSPGSSSLVLNILGFKIAFSVCYDLRFSYLYWDLAKTTDLFVILANWPDTRAWHWKSLLVARAIENQAYVIGVNRVGKGGELEFAGGSLAISPSGEIMTEGGVTEELLIVDLDLDALSAVRNKFPFLNDRLK